MALFKHNFTYIILFYHEDAPAFGGTLACSLL